MDDGGANCALLPPLALLKVTSAGSHASTEHERFIRLDLTTTFSARRGTPPQPMAVNIHQAFKKCRNPTCLHEGSALCQVTCADSIRR
jgi:hypothetical protein